MIKIEIEYENGKLKLNSKGARTSDAELIVSTPTIVREIVISQASQIQFNRKDANVYAMTCACIEKLEELKAEIINEAYTRE